MYLREMGSVELLSREGEIAIAKRIEAGRETMIAGLCESPLTFQAIIIWRDELNEGKILLREIIDLEATYAGPDAKPAPPVERPEEIERAARPPRRRQPPRRAPRDDDDITNVGGESRGLEEEEEDDDESQPVARRDGSRTAPAGDGDPRPIADTYKKLRKLQDQQVEKPAGRRRHAVAQPGAPLQGAQGRADHGGEVAVAQPEPHRGLVEQLYDINKRLVQNEGKLLRLAESYGVTREEFLQRVSGLRARPELDEVDRQPVGARLEGVRQEREGRRSSDLRAEIQNLATETGDLDRRIPPHRQPGAEGRARSRASPRRKWSRPTCAS